MYNSVIKSTIKRMTTEGKSNLEIKEHLSKKGVSCSRFDVNMHELGRQTTLKEHAIMLYGDEEE